MTQHHAFCATLVLLLATGLVSGCSRDTSASAVNARAQSAPGGQQQGELLGTGDAIELAADYERQCSREEKPSRDCEILRGLLVVEVAIALEEIERSRDQRGTEEALAALDLADEPEIVIAASRILGQFPGTEGVAAKMLPFVLESAYAQVQRAAAQVLKATPDPDLAQIGEIWLRNHDGLVNADTYDEYPDFPAHYAGLGFPKYPGAEWFSPADSDRSIGWSTKDDVNVVARWFAQALRADVLDDERWLQIQTEQASASPGVDQSTLTRLQQLAARASRGDQAALAEIDKLQNQLNAAQQDRSAANDKSVDQVAAPPASSGSAARWIIAQKKGARISRLVLVYPLPALKRTVIQFAWDLADYPSAWPKPRPEVAQ